MSSSRRLLDKLRKKDEKAKKPKADPNKVPLGSGMAGQAKDTIKNRQRNIDDMIRQNGG